VSGAAKNPLDHFLFESKGGHCEFYSTGMAVLLRTLGVPTRNVTGFIGGTFNRFGRYYAVRQGDAHSWVEVYLDGRGWTRFDPTPPADAAPRSDITGVLAFVRDFVEATAQRWNRHVVGYDLKQQISLYRSMRTSYAELKQRSPILRDAIGSPRRTLALFGGLALVGFAFVWLRRNRRAAAGARPTSSPREAAALQVVELYRALDAALAARGAPRPVSTPPLLHARGLVDAGHPLGTDALELTELYLACRFGGRTLSDEDRRQFARRVRLMRQVRVEARPEAA
jgi:hypothetical protein